MASNLCKFFNHGSMIISWLYELRSGLSSPGMLNGTNNIRKIAVSAQISNGLFLKSEEVSLDIFHQLGCTLALSHIPWICI